jgi:biopolymer transport protein ExbD/beta-lactamase regulating signal transducer with metallopeptidase domain
MLMRKEASFAVNRATLLTIVLASVIVPLVQLPQLMQTPVHVELIPDFSENMIQIQNLPASEYPSVTEVKSTVSDPTSPTNELTVSLETLLKYFYIAGVLVAMLLFIQNMFRIFFLARKATVRPMDGYRLLIVDREVPSFAFGRSVVISRTDYDAHGPAILAHEQAHIRLNHFVDLLLLELVKTIHWFNPAVYALIGDMKEIHEFQADEQTLHSGIDAKLYQLLIIQKGVGPRRFALANSFNHCQIKKRITMMNKSKTSKAWHWKVATFLPLLALLLMAFGKPGELKPNKDAPENELVTSSIPIQSQQSQTDRVIQIKSDGNYIGSKLCSLGEIENAVKNWANSSNEWIQILAEKATPNHRIDEILEKLGGNAALYHFTISFDNSDIVYPAWDVSSTAKFQDGSWNKWLNDQLSQYSKGKSDQLDFDLKYRFIIDKTGKVSGARIVKASQSDEINKAMEKILSQIPDWRPAQRGSQAVSVLYDEIWKKKAKSNSTMMFIPPPPPPPANNKTKTTNTGGISQTSTPLIIDIQKDGNYVNKKLCSITELKQIVEKEKKNDPDTFVWIQAVDDIPATQISEVKEILKTQNIKFGNRTIKLSHVIDSLNKINQIIPIRFDDINPEITSIIYLDGLCIDKTKFLTINPDSVKFVDLLKGSAYTEKYGNEAKKGIIAITSLHRWNEINATKKISYFIDGVKSTPEQFKALSSESIKSLNVLKGEDATKIYGNDAGSEVVDVKLKHSN